MPLFEPNFGCLLSEGPSYEGAASELYSLLSALLQPAAVNYNIRASIILSGPAGVGKSHAARMVANDLGLHFSEVRENHSLRLDLRF